MQLLDLVNSLKGKITQLESLRTDAAIVHQNFPEINEAVLCYLVIKLHDIWSEHCRLLVLRSVVGDFHTLGNVHHPPTGISKSRALIDIRAANNGRMPRYHWPMTCINICNTLSVSINASITSGLGTVTIIEEFTNVRNYIAHSNPDAIREYINVLRQDGRSHVTLPGHYSQLRDYGSNVRKYDTWKTELTDALEAACQ